MWKNKHEVIPISNVSEQIIIRKIIYSILNQFPTAQVHSFSKNTFHVKTNVIRITGMHEVHDTPHRRVRADTTPGSTNITSILVYIKCT